MTGDLIGAWLGKYAICAVLGRGRMSVVYEGYDPPNDRPVVVKVLTAPISRG